MHVGSSDLVHVTGGGGGFYLRNELGKTLELDYGPLKGIRINAGEQTLVPDGTSFVVRRGHKTARGRVENGSIVWDQG